MNDESENCCVRFRLVDSNLDGSSCVSKMVALHNYNAFKETFSFFRRCLIFLYVTKSCLILFKSYIFFLNKLQSLMMSSFKGLKFVSLGSICFDKLESTKRKRTQQFSDSSFIQEEYFNVFLLLL